MRHDIKCQGLHSASFLFPFLFHSFEGIPLLHSFILPDWNFLSYLPHSSQIVAGLCLKDPSVCTERLSCPSYRGKMYSKWDTSKVNVGDKCLYLESASALILVSIFFFFLRAWQMCPLGLGFKHLQSAEHFRRGKTHLILPSLFSQFRRSVG